LGKSNTIRDSLSVITSVNGDIFVEKKWEQNLVRDGIIQGSDKRFH